MNPIIAQIQIGNNIAGQNTDDRFGSSVALSTDGNIVAIGNPFNFSNTSDAGFVKVFQWSNDVWSQIGNDILGEAPEDHFGTTVSISANGNTVAIGAPNNDGNGTNAGHVRVYRLVNNVWMQMGTDLDGATLEELAGTSISLSSDGNRLAIGAPDNGENGTMAGEVRIFDFDDVQEEWIQKGDDINGVTQFIGFGGAISLSSDGNRIAAGASGYNGNGFNSGLVQVYEFLNNQWTQIGSDIVGEEAYDAIGQYHSSISLSSDGNRMAIGAAFNDGNGQAAGHVRIFQLNNNDWEQIGEDIDGVAANDFLGWSVALSANGNKIAIGTPYNDGDGTYFNVGMVQLYEYTQNEWLQVGVDIYGDAEGGILGNAVAISSNGNKIATGAPGAAGLEPEAGHVKIFEFPCSPTAEVDIVEACETFTWIDGNNYTENNNTATFTFTNTAGCDSIITLDLTILNNSSNSDIISACETYTWIDGNVYTESNNTATFTSTNTAGCDSIITLDLTILSDSFSSDIISACETYTWIDGNIYTESNNTAMFTLANTAGCDSIITLDLTITDLPFVNLGADTTICEGDILQLSTNTNGTYEWNTGATTSSIDISESGEYTLSITDEFGCVSTDAIQVTVEICTNQEEVSVLSNISIYPNPTSGTFFIESSEFVDLKIYNLLGQEIEARSFANQQEIYLKNQGVYYLYFSNQKGQRKLMKLIVQ